MRLATFPKMALLAAFLLIATTMKTSAAPPAATDKPQAKPAEKLEPYECGDVKRLHTFAGIFLASQPQPHDFITAKEAGIKTVINLRLEDEQDWNEAALIKKLGMEYHHVPFKAPDTLTDAVFETVRNMLKKEDRPVILHCSSANRVGAVWLAYRVLDGGLGYEDALSEAKTVGLKLPTYEEKAKDYIDRMQK